MAYQVLARKWRPKTFASLKGQEHVTKALINALTQGKLHHAYLFTGTRGVGKTTIARILAKSLNCEQGTTPTPCGVCSACVEIDAGRFVDLIEVDAASRTRVEDTRELLDNVQYAPSVGRYKIYLIDEVHMLSGHSFNALLKTLEEPPPHVKFILATTDPERIPITVLSRCLRLSLRAVCVADIVAQLQEILASENTPFEERACQKIAQLAAGSMRDALSLLEQAIAYGNGALLTQDVESMLGLSFQTLLPDLMQALAASDAKQCLAWVATQAQQGTDFEQVLMSILQALHAIAIAQMVPDADTALASFAMVDSILLAMKEAFSAEEVQLLYQIGLMGQKDLRFAPNPQIGFEMILLRMVAFRPVKVFLPVSPTASTQIHLEKKPEEIPGNIIENSIPAPVAQKIPEQKVENIEKVGLEIINWVQIVPRLTLSPISASLVKHCVVSVWEQDKLVLILEESQKACLNPAREMQIQEAVSQYFRRPIKLQIKVGAIEAGSITPSQQAQTQARERQEMANTAIEQDQHIQNMISAFDATVEKITTLE